MKRTYDLLTGHTAQIQVANELRKLANRASPNSLRSIERGQQLSARVSLQTVANVMAGKSSARSARNVSAVTDSILNSIADLEDSERAELRANVLTVLADAMTSESPRLETPRLRLRSAQHFLNVAFDWASALPRGPRGGIEVIATVAVPAVEHGSVRLEVFDSGIDHDVHWEVLEGSLARKYGQAGWTDYRDDGSTWHGLWGPVHQDDSRPLWFLAVFLDAFGAVSVYLRTLTPSEMDLVVDAAVAAAFDVVNVLGWSGDADVLAQSVGPSQDANRNRGFTRSAGAWRTWVHTRLPLPPKSSFPLGNSIAARLVHGLDPTTVEYEQQIRELSRRRSEFLNRARTTSKRRTR